MSVRFDAAGDLLRRTSGTLPALNAITMAGWFALTVDRDDWTDILSAYAGSSGDSVMIGTDSDGTGLMLLRNWTGDTPQATLVVTTWYYLGFTGGADQRLYWAADGAATLNTTTFVRTNTSTATGLQVACQPGSTDEHYNGEARDLRTWGAVLTKAELEAEMLSATPVRTLNLLDRLPLVDAATATSETSGNGNTWTAGGTLTTGATDPVIYGSALALEGYRWRNDDGSESAATWAAAQDANLTAPIDTVRRLRMLVDATGDPTAQSFRLEYRKVGDPTWKAVA